MTCHICAKPTCLGECMDRFKSGPSTGHVHLADASKSVIDGLTKRITELENLLIEETASANKWHGKVQVLEHQNKEMRNALGEIEWSNDTKWQADRAKDALAKVRDER